MNGIASMRPEQSIWKGNRCTFVLHGEGELREAEHMAWFSAYGRFNSSWWKQCHRGTVRLESASWQRDANPNKWTATFEFARTESPHQLLPNSDSENIFSIPNCQIYGECEFNRINFGEPMAKVGHKAIPCSEFPCLPEKNPHHYHQGMP